MPRVVVLQGRPAVLQEEPEQRWRARRVSAPAPQRSLCLVLGALTGVLAGPRPARRAARLNVLTAIAAA